MYKYECRGCPVQESCIDQSDTAPGAKVMIRNAFAARTDTMSTWATLQKTCLLVQEDEERERRAREGSMLGRRMREARAKQEEPEETDEESVQPDTPVQDDDSLDDTPAPLELPVITPNPAPSNIEVVSNSPETETPKVAVPSSALGTHALGTAPLDHQPVPKDSEFFWLIIRASQRRISLPITGKLILGRYDPMVIHPLDVDLTYEDQDAMTVSRRHAKIVGVDGYHTIEDMNSSNGLLINGKQMPTHQAHQIQPGDQIVLGKLQMVYDRVPLEFLDMLSRREVDQFHHFLFHNHTGRRMSIAPRGDITIGRFEPSKHIPPNINLIEDGVVSSHVSRHHAKITWRAHSPLLQDLDSSYGTRLNGKALQPRQTAPLKPGDHISLGGCVLAYDVEM